MLSQPTQKYLQQTKNFLEKQAENAPRIHADYVASRLATLYEKLRQVIDYQEEHLLRKNTIERILKRRLLTSENPIEISRDLVLELIRGGYFPNDRIPETKIEEVKNFLEKYIFLINSLPQALNNLQKNQLAFWLEELAACEIEETLAPPQKETTLLVYMIEAMKERVQTENNVTEEQKNLYIFIACQKALLKSDRSLISFKLFKYYYETAWPNLDQQGLQALSERIGEVKSKIEKNIGNPLARKIFRAVSAHTASFLVIGDIVSESPTGAMELFDNSQALEQKLLLAYNQRYLQCKEKIRRSGVRSVISIFLSKIALALLIEIPFDMYVTKSFSWTILGINLAVPPFLMFLIVLSIKPPKPENASRVIMDAIKIIKLSEKLETHLIRVPQKRGRLLNMILAFTYLLVSGLIFGAMTYGLMKMHFSLLSIVIFFIFFCLIAFSGIKTQQWARELKISEEKEGITSFLADLFFLPFITVGKWLSGQIQKYNIFILTLNLFFEAPLQTFFEFMESWRGYIKEKKEEAE